MKISENPKCQLRSCRNSKKESVKNPGNSGFFHRPFSVLHFLIVSSFVCAFLVPCGGRVQFLFNNNSNANNNVSMPCGGLISFLQPGKKEVFPMNMLCQCPTSGFSHFYCVMVLFTLALAGCVNALYRASPISTIPFKKPYKINGFRDRFQGVIVRKF